ncbi:hypothetical protein KKC94_02400 [Patescibacteria group bacterium]|nr:hypothetical protein [Patescibacteria group bacterium]
MSLECYDLKDGDISFIENYHIVFVVECKVKNLSNKSVSIDEIFGLNYRGDFFSRSDFSVENIKDERIREMFNFGPIYIGPGEQKNIRTISDIDFILLFPFPIEDSEEKEADFAKCNISPYGESTAGWINSCFYENTGYFFTDFLASSYSTWDGFGVGIIMSNGVQISDRVEHRYGFWTSNEFSDNL